MLWDPKSKISLWSGAISLSAGPHRASENFACNPQICKQNFLVNIFKVCTWNKVCSVVYLKAKNEEKLQNSKFLWPGQKQFWNWTHKNIANQQQCAHFRKSQKINITPPYSAWLPNAQCPHPFPHPSLPCTLQMVLTLSEFNCEIQFSMSTIYPLAVGSKLPSNNWVEFNLIT